MTRTRIEFDSTTGGFVSLQNNDYTDENFIATVSQTTFELATDIDASQNIDVWVNGMRMFEGASDDWARSAGTDDVVFNDGLPADSRVDVRIWDR